MDESSDAAGQSSDTYGLIREPRETKRLDDQHVLYTNAFGYCLHPDIVLPKDAKIADVGTGTGVFIRDLSSKLPASTEFHGFDISDAQFPTGLSQSNIYLHVWNCKDSFPEQYHGIFDAVHVRLFIAALNTEDEWALIIKNLTQLLKPGGRLQWVECDGIGCVDVFRDNLNAQRDEYIRALRPVVGSKAVRDKLEFPTRNLARLFREAGLRDVMEDMVSTDREPHMRRETTRISIGALVSRMKVGFGDGISYSDSQIREHEAKWLACMESGAYHRYNLHSFVGTKSE